MDDLRVWAGRARQAAVGHLRLVEIYWLDQILDNACLFDPSSAVRPAAVHVLRRHPGYAEPLRRLRVDPLAGVEGDPPPRVLQSLTAALGQG